MKKKYFTPILFLFLFFSIIPNVHAVSAAEFALIATASIVDSNSQMFEVNIGVSEDDTGLQTSVFFSSIDQQKKFVAHTNLALKFLDFSQSATLKQILNDYYENRLIDADMATESANIALKKASSNLLQIQGIIKIDWSVKDIIVE